jgi:serine/threonine protein kinase
MGEVYRARDTRLGRTVALKVLPEAFANDPGSRLTEVFIRMTEQEIKAFDLRAGRISKIHIILSEHDAKR